MLGNAVISKKFLRTCKIHLGDAYNERGECCPRTLTNRKRKCYDNAFDVVVCLHDLTDPSIKGTTPPRFAHIQLGDVPRTLDPAEVEGEFRQHAGMMTVMMKLPTQSFA